MFFHGFDHDYALFESRKPRGSNGVNHFNVLLLQQQLQMQRTPMF